MSILAPLVLALVLSGAPAAPGPARPAAKLIVEQGPVWLATSTGKPLPVPDKLDLKEGDVLTTPATVKGKIELASGASVALAPLTRYRVGRDGIYEPAGAKGWRKIPTGAEAVRPAIVDEAPGVGLLAKLRVLSGRAYHRPAGWPQAVAVRGSVSLAEGDDVRLEPGSCAQVAFAGGGWLGLEGPALFTLEPDAIHLESGRGLARSLAPRTLVAGPYRIDPGGQSFTFATKREGIEVAALSGILSIRSAHERTHALAAGRVLRLTRGRPATGGNVDIRGEWRRYEALVSGRVVRAPVVEPEPDVTVPEKKPRERAPDAKKEPLDGPGPERRSGPPDPRVEDPGSRALLPLRDRLRAGSSAANRLFYVKKREEKEAKVDLATFAERAKTSKKAPDEVESLRLFRLDRRVRRAVVDLADFRHDREFAFEERLNLVTPEKDRTVRETRERLFGEPLFLVTRRLLPAAEARVAQATAQANALSLQARILRETGAPQAEIDAVLSGRQDVLDDAQAEVDGLKEEIRIQAEPYR